MRLKNIPGSRDVIAESPYVIHTPEQFRGHFRVYFAEEAGDTQPQSAGRPLHIEIGTGKGQFIMAMAKRHPEVLYIGIEKYSSVLLRAVQKMEAADAETPQAGGGAPENLRFIRLDAENIADVFAENEVDRIYLNFSDPWPKDRHAKRRLTSRLYFARYDRILAPAGEVCFKTDNENLFDFSLCEAAETLWQYRDVTRDLHHSLWAEGNVMTEYEERFSAEGKPICRAVFFR